jgi:WD40 repeat protein
MCVCLFVCEALVVLSYPLPLVGIRWPMPSTVNLDGASFSPDGTRAVSWERYAHHVRLWDVASGVVLGSLAAGEVNGIGHVLKSDWCPTDRRLITTDDGATLCLWDLDTTALVDSVMLGVDTHVCVCVCVCVSLCGEMTAIWLHTGDFVMLQQVGSSRGCRF